MKERSNSIFRVHWQWREKRKEGEKGREKGGEMKENAVRRSKYFKSSSSFELKRLRNHSPSLPAILSAIYCPSDHVRAPFNRLIWISPTFSSSAIRFHPRHIEFARIVARIRNCRANFIGRPRAPARGNR